MATKITKKYILEQLTSDSVNVVTVSHAKVNAKNCEISRERMSYPNSTIGRELISKAIPKEYLSAVLVVWGENPTMDNPKNKEEF
ncbi:MAG: hypothetical protein MSH11_09540 [Ruminococcus sp.]|nr:hypothetical protein [Ruminococcus sp.]